MRLLLSLVALATFTSTAFAQPRADLSVSDGFGTNAQSFLLVDVENLTRDELSGQVIFNLESSRTYVHQVSVPARGTRNLRIELPYYEGSLRATFVVEGETLARWNSATWSSNAHGAIVLAERGAARNLLTSITGEDLTGARGSMGAYSFDVGRVIFDQAGDPIVPETLEGWRNVELVLAATRDLPRLSAEQRDALRRLVWSGATLVLGESAPEDMARPELQEFVRDDGAWTVQPFGRSQALGFGSVWTMPVDIDQTSALDDAELRRALETIVHDLDSRVGSTMPYFGQESLESWGSELVFPPLRSALDPNESYKPALAFVAVVLLLYVFFVGPINFGYVQKRGKPTLALITTPLIALACLLIMLFVGYVGKGVTMRYRQASFVEMIEGSPFAHERTYRGLFSTRPANFALPPGEHVAVLGDGRGEMYLAGDGPMHMGNLRSALWETVFVREARIGDAGGAVRFELDSFGKVRTVHNDTDMELRHAVVVMSSGEVLDVGDVAPHSSQGVVGPLPDAFSPSPYQMLEKLMTAMEVPRDERDALRGLATLAGGFDGAARRIEPVLYALGDTGPDEDYSVFGRERAQRLIRIHGYRPSERRTWAGYEVESSLGGMLQEAGENGEALEEALTDLGVSDDTVAEELDAAIGVGDDEGEETEETP